MASRKKILVIGALIAAAVLVGVPYYSYSGLGATDGEDKIEFSYNVLCAGTSGTISLLADVDDGVVEKPDFLSYLVSYWSFEEQEAIRVADPKFAVSTTVLFTAPDGSKEWLFQQLEEYGADALNVAQQRAFEVAMLGEAGTYTITVALLLKGSTGSWNMTIAWDKEIIEVEA
jgi:hypothetical protein